MSLVFRVCSSIEGRCCVGLRRFLWEGHSISARLQRSYSTVLDSKKGSFPSSPRVCQILQSIELKSLSVDHSADTENDSFKRQHKEGLSKLMKLTLDSIATLSLQETVELLNIVASRQLLQIRGFQTVALQYSEFWNQAVFEVMRNWHTQFQFGQLTKGKGLDPTLLQFVDVLSLIQFELNTSHQHLLNELWTQLKSVPQSCRDDYQQSGNAKITSIVDEIVKTANGVANLIQLGHFYKSEEEVILLQRAYLSDSLPIATFINHFMDNNNISLKEFVEVFYILTCMGIFCPEFLTASILLYKRRAFELPTKGYIQLMKSAAMLYLQRIHSIPNLKPHWMIREEVAKMQQQQIQNLRELKESIETGNHPFEQHETETPSWGSEKSPIRYYNQNFFNEFENQSESLNVVLGSKPSNTNATSVSIEENMRDISEQWEKKDSMVDVVKRTVEVESVFLVKLICDSMHSDQISYFSSDELVTLLEILGSIQYVPGKLITRLVKEILPPRLEHFRPVQLASIAESFSQLNVRNSHFFQLLCREVMSHTSEWTIVSLVNLVFSLTKLNCGSTELLIEISKRRDELFRSPMSAKEFQKLEEVSGVKLSYFQPRSSLKLPITFQPSSLVNDESQDELIFFATFLNEWEHFHVVEMNSFPKCKLFFGMNQTSRGLNDLIRLKCFFANTLHSVRMRESTF